MTSDNTIPRLLTRHLSLVTCYLSLTNDSLLYQVMHVYHPDVLALAANQPLPNLAVLHKA